MERLPGRLLLCSPELPPYHTGHATVLARLFRDIDPRDYCMVAFAPDPPTPDPSLPRLGGRTHRLPTSWLSNARDAPVPLRPVRAIRRFATEAVIRGRRLAALIRSEECRALLVTSSNTPDLPAAMIAARLTGVPLLISMFDDWRHLIATQGRLIGLFASVAQGPILAAADTVMVLNPLLRDSLMEAYGCDPLVTRIPLPEGVDVSERSAERPWPRDPDDIRLVFTGQVYGAHHDAIGRILQALESPLLRRVSLHIYSSNVAQDLRRAGLDGRFVLHPYVPWPEIHQVQRDADILLLPLGFSSPYPEIIRTAAPTKMGEYLASGTPLLIHVPPDSYPAMVARTEGIGALVDSTEPGRIVDALLRLIEDRPYREGIIRSAQRVALGSHSDAATRGRFVAALRSSMGDVRVAQPVATYDR